MEEKKKLKNDLHDHDDQLPEDVLNIAQDPDSIKDPLKEQLEKSKDIEDENTQIKAQGNGNK